MKWGTKKKNPITKSKEEEVVVVEEINTKQPPSSSSSSSSTFSLSSWFSKILLKPPRATSNPQPVIPKRNAAPAAKPLLSPPPLPPRAGDITPRRLSIGDDQTHLARTRTQSLPHRSHRRHISLGSELDFMPESPHLRKLRVDPDQVRSGRRSFGGKVRPKVRVHSPRLASLGARRGLERFAVVKRSRDPVRDFRESMVEMIWEKGIGRPDELEKLLACYLSLNSDEHHDVIVKVFRQVWFDLNRDMVRLRDRFDPHSREHKLIANPLEDAKFFN